MIRSGKAIFLDVAKTGTSYTHDLLDTVGYISQNDRHHGVQSCTIPLDGCIFFTNFRNPWNHWVSHYTFAKRTKGNIWKSVTDEKDLSFSDYVHKINIDRIELNNKRNKLGDCWKNFPKKYGLMTCLYIVLTEPDFLLSKRSASEVKNWYNRTWFHSPTEESIYNPIMLENIEFDTMFLINRHEKYFNLKENWWDIDLNLNKKKHKIQKELDHKSYHDDDTISIIKEKEKLIIDHFLYRYE